jgi:hypothetical protein
MQQACRNHHETLMLDAMGELNDHRLRRTWKAHLEACAPCRAERQRLVRLLATMRAAAVPPELSGAESGRMAGRVLSGLRPTSPRPVSLGWRWRMAPAMVAAGLMVIVAAAGYYLQDRFFESEKTADLRIEDQLPSQDAEVIKQLDFLRTMDTIEKLVHVVDLDSPPEGTPAGEEPSHTQGARSIRNAYELA